MSTSARCRALEAKLAAAPNDPASWLELAELRRGQRQAGDALTAANNALTLDPANAAAQYEKGAALLDLGFAEDAASLFTSILAIEPLNQKALTSLGSAYFSLKYLELAAEVWEQAARIGGVCITTLEDLAICYQRLGDLDRVAETWERVLRIDPNHPEAQHHLAALGKLPANDRASRAYLVKLFDGFADTFDDTLDSLGYEGPRLLGEAVLRCQRDVPADLDILDLGCGTGGSAIHLHPWAARLEGVDLSPRMLDKARSLGVYDHLHCADMLDYCHSHEGAYDLVFAADSINYFGRLDELFRGIRHTLRPGGIFAFFVEMMEEADADGYCLKPHGRFSHQDEYVYSCLESAGFLVSAHDEAVIRSEAGRPVGAILYVAKSTLP
jgi:predicted TPR repeat methyltransferase